MVVCIIAEGSYPYIAGGVSSWISNLILGMPNIQFKILSIMPKREEEIKYKYQLTNNIVEIKTIYLDDFKLNKVKWLYKQRVTDKEETEILKFLSFSNNVNWEMALKVLSDQSKIGNPLEFLKSKQFWEMLTQIYDSKFSEEGLNYFVHTYKSILAVIMNLVQEDMPVADIYHSVSTGYAGILGVLCKLKYKKPYILTEHGIYAREREEDIVQSDWVHGAYKRMWIDYFYFLSMGAYKNADRIISLFERNKEIQMELGAKENRLRVISNGVDFNKFHLVEHTSESEYNIGAVLRIVPIKDVKTLIKAFKFVKKEVPEAVLYLIGPTDEDKSYFNECVQLIKWHKLEKDIIFTGRVNISDYMHKLKVMVLTSISEGQPLVILEAFGSGIPVVSTDVGSCRELIEGGMNDSIGKAGIITKPVSPKETADALIKIICNKDIAETYGHRGRKRVMKFYDQKFVIKNYLEEYNNLMLGR